MRGIDEKKTTEKGMALLCAAVCLLMLTACVFPAVDFDTEESEDESITYTVHPTFRVEDEAGTV